MKKLLSAVFVPVDKNTGKSIPPFDTFFSTAVELEFDPATPPSDEAMKIHRALLVAQAYAEGAFKTHFGNDQVLAKLQSHTFVNRD